MLKDSYQIQSRMTQARLSRLGRFSLIVALTWAIFTVYYGLHEQYKISIVCLTGLLTTLCIYPYTRGSLKQATFVATILMGFTLCMICMMGLLTGQAGSYSTLYLCCFGVFAAHMIGVKASLVWSVVCMVAMAAINHQVFTGPLPALHTHTAFDKTLHCIGVTLVLFFFDWQAQHYFNVQTKDLVKLTKSLKKQAAQFERLAQFDSLTGLRNRHSFEQSLAKFTNESDYLEFSLLLLDLDGFKEINDTRGHKTGDAILQAVAARLIEYVGDKELVTRLGGDEFTIILPDVTSEYVVSSYVQRLSDALTHPFRVDGQDYCVGVSIGVARYPYDSNTEDELFSFADTAMYEAKRNQVDFVLYNIEMTKSLVQRKLLDDRLLQALDNNEFHLFYQPQLTVAEQRITGAEALLRWKKDGEWLMPGTFVHLLESSREVRRVGRWILKQACLQVREWSQAGFDLSVSVNVSSVQFQDPEILDHILESIEESGIDPSRLDIEITETLLIEDMRLATRILTDLRQLGVSVSIDDFGTGYSSLKYLRDLPLTRLKIDRAFIKGIPDKDDGVIAQTIIDLAHNLGKEVLAEGIETQEQLEFLAANHCDMFQGFFHSQPMPVKEFREFMLNSRKNPKLSAPLDLSPTNQQQPPHSV